MSERYVLARKINSVFVPKFKTFPNKALSISFEAMSGALLQKMNFLFFILLVTFDDFERKDEVKCYYSTIFIQNLYFTYLFVYLCIVYLLHILQIPGGWNFISCSLFSW